MFHQNWCKETVIALKHGKKVKPYQVFVSGPGRVGKSNVIKLIQSDIIKLLKLSGMSEPDNVIVLLSAPTGVAAFNIGGMTTFRRSKFGEYQSLSHDKANTLRLKLSKLKILVIDEISMVGCNMLLDIHKRFFNLQFIKQLQILTHESNLLSLIILQMGSFSYSNQPP